MFQFFSAISGFITTIVSYIINMFSMLLILLGSMVSGIGWLFAMIALLPPFLTAFIVVPVSLAIFYQVINKGS